MKLKVYLICAALVFGALSTNAQRSKRRSAAAAKPSTTLVDTIVKVKPVPADSFSIAVGQMLAPSLRAYALQSLNVDEAHMSDFVEGLRANIDEKQTKKLMAYAAGLNIAQQNKTSIIPNFNRTATGSADSSFVVVPLFLDALTSSLMTNDQAAAEQAGKLVERQAAYQSQVFQSVNAQYLTENAKKDGVVSLPSGLQYRIIEKGQGIVAADTNTVEVHYEGKLIDGTVFDSSYQRGQTAEFKPTQVIKGWHEALTMMPEGSTWELVIPYNLAYGEKGNRNIPPYSTLIFKVQVVKVK